MIRPVQSWTLSFKHLARTTSGEKLAKTAFVTKFYQNQELFGAPLEFGDFLLRKVVLHTHNNHAIIML